MANRMSWFLTPTGRKFSMGFVTAASITAFGARYFPHTFFLHKYKEVVSMYQSAVPVAPSESVMKLWNETLADLRLAPQEISNLEPFTVFGFDLFRAGWLTSRYGAVIGLPINFTYTDVSSVDPTPILVNGEKIDWDGREAKELLQGLILSEDAKRYGIAREILMARNSIPLVSSITASFTVSSTYLLCRSINEKFRLLHRPLPVRVFVYFMGCIFSYFVWTAQNDYFTRYCESEVDTRLAQLDHRYTKGAIEFYGKMLKRNSALRSLLGAQGEKNFTPTGDERFFIRQPRISIEERKAFFDNNLVNIRRNKEALDDDGFVNLVDKKQIY